MGPGVSTAPSCKTQLACHEETFTGNAKRELAVVQGIAPLYYYQPPIGRSIQQPLLALGTLPLSQALTPSVPNRQVGLRPSQRDYYVARENRYACRYINRRNLSLERYAGKIYLRSKQELCRRERFWLGLNRRRYIRRLRDITKPLENQGRGLNKQVY